MKKLALLTTSVCLCFGLYFYQNTTTSPTHRLPTDGTIVRTGQSEDEDNANRREQYFELMHRTAPDTDWRAIDRQTRKKQYEEKLSLRQLKSTMPIETFGNGALEGEWFERGSKDQSGSIRSMDYDVDNDKIYLVSDGGTIWKGSRAGNDWIPQNEDLQFDPTIIKVIDNASGGKRLLASISKEIHYSDDDGVTWQTSGGFNFYTDYWGGPRSMYVMNDANNTIYYLVEAWDTAPWDSRLWLFRSIDRGLSFTQIHTFQHGDETQISMWSPFNSNELYILDRSNLLYQVTGATVSLLNINTDLPTGVDNHLRGHKSGSTLTLYALTDDSDIYKSMDSGASWTLQGTLPASAWDIGIEVSLSNPDRLYAGEVDAFRSFNGGTSWTRVNNWYEYYSDVTNKLHADMMAFGAFYDQSGLEFTLIANHGGISISYNNMITNVNIALQNLNVSQYYDVVTSDANVNYMYAGTQDQGFQRSNMAAGTGVENWQQYISGDYGHMIFSNNGQSLWIQYPGGDMQYYANPRTGGITAQWTMTGNDLPSYGWMLPSAETPNYIDNSIYMGGGDLNGGSGNYLVTLTYSGGNISATQGTYDFKANANSGGSISAIEASILDVNRLYVAMDDGTFFYSNDLGGTWSKTTSFSGPGNWWLYGASILASDVTSNVVYYGGSGYSNPAVYKSTNGGQTFTAMSNGLPNTLVHELAANADESLLFAATEVGPYVYVAAQNQWFDMRGISAPMQRYTSVEYIDSEEVVRFGTYGRGAWDFKVSACATVDLDIRFDGFPTQTSWNITDANGVAVASGDGSGAAGNSNIIENACLPDGCYTLNFYDAVNNGMCPFQSNAGSSATFITPGTLISPGSVVATLGSVVIPGLCGSYTLYDTDGTVLATGGGEFGASEANTFCLSNGVANFTNADNDAFYMRQNTESLGIISSMEVFPTLTKNEVTIRYSLDNLANAQLYIVDANGQIIQQYAQDKNDQQEIKFDASHLPSGFYFVQLVSEESVMVRKFIKQ